MSAHDTRVLAHDTNPFQVALKPLPYPSAQSRAQVLAEHDIDEHEAARSVEQNRRLFALQPPAHAETRVELAICVIDKLIDEARDIRRMLGAVDDYARFVAEGGVPGGVE